MSIMYCNKCNQYVDMDYNSEHFDEHLEEAEKESDVRSPYAFYNDDNKIYVF